MTRDIRCHLNKANNIHFIDESELCIPPATTVPDGGQIEIVRRSGT